MFKIEKYSKIVNRAIDYVIVNEDNENEVICLFINDWNGEIYTNSAIYNKINGFYISLNRRFRPIYAKFGDDFEIIGFEEVY